MEKATSPFRLPQIIDYTENAISDITSSFHAPRTILTTNCEIAYAWGALPQEIEKIPLCRRNELLARMCVAVSCGLFDSGINYVWNATIIFLRQKIESFGLPFIAQILEKDFSESKLNDMQDSELLDLTLKLNIISEDAFFFLDQCRNIRNNFSAAHPPIGIINGVEFIAFLNRCVRYVLGSDAQNDLHGIDINECIHAVKADIFSEEQKAEWIRRLKTTCDAQRQLIFPILHGIYCDPTSNESARGNAIQICKDSVSFFSNKVISNLLNKHSEYIANGDTKRHNASRSFFTHIGLLHLLSEAERHSIISNALQRLWVAHLELNNFYNEKPFAEQLMHLVLNT